MSPVLDLYLSENSYPKKGSQYSVISLSWDTCSKSGVRPSERSKSRVADRLVLRTIMRHALATGALLASLDAAAVDIGAAESLAKHSGCNKCHAVEKKKDGPALR